MGRLGQLHASVGLAFLVTAASVTACSSTDTPDTEPAAPTSTTAPTRTGETEAPVADARAAIARVTARMGTTGETEAPVADAAAASLPATSIQTTDLSSFEQLCYAVSLWGAVRGILTLSMGMIPLGRDIDESIGDVEEFNEQLNERLENTLVPAEDIPDDYIVLSEDVFELVGGTIDGSLSDEHQKFADAFFEFMGERVETFEPDSPIRFSSLLIDDLPNADVVNEECGFQ